MAGKTETKITIKEIAQRANVSVGTVSKVLNGDQSVKESNRKAVEEAVQFLDYNVNKLARSLAHKPLRIGVLLPSEFKEYYCSMLNGIQKAVEALSDYKVSAEYERYMNYNDDDIVNIYLDKFEQEEISGIILGPSSVGTHSKRIAELQKKGIPVVVVMSDMKNTGRLACIRVDATISGQTAADLSQIVLNQDEEVAVYVGNKDMEEHLRKAEGFSKRAKELGVHVAGIYETHEEAEIAYQLTHSLLQKNPKLRLIYVATANSVSVCKCINDCGKEKEVHVVATDLLPDLRPYVENGTAIAMLDQHLEQQGIAAVNVLYRYLSEGVLNSEETKISPSLLLKSGMLKQMEAGS